jgi:hypothetical protein
MKYHTKFVYHKHNLCTVKINFVWYKPNLCLEIDCVVCTYDNYDFLVYIEVKFYDKWRKLTRVSICVGEYTKYFWCFFLNMLL